MTVTMSTNSPQYLGPMSWLISWSGGAAGATYYVYRDGQLIATTPGSSIVLSVEPGETPIIEVFDDADTAPMESHPGRVTLAWYASTGAAVDHYRIDEYVSSVWTARARIKDNGDGYFLWRSRGLEDVTTHQFRVVPVGDNGNEGTADTRNVLMVRYPDSPDLSVAWDSGTNKVTFSAN